ncbi:MAG: hypothetical protein E6H99_15240 [Chloroflexi bacterium]|nr:MAG: hypothetical protein E6I13_00760 [Chloroflexota bacterium]TMG15984.1 MAG: hypothetical protein E6H99_15240 [Chloroflexota bacterium]TMG65616.1 MAG: hypothetical protein E6H82_10705 [Chloroflexota bacterium]
MTLRELWERGEPTVGGWCVIPSPFAAELMGRAGYDWVCIDTRHARPPARRRGARARRARAI